MPGLNARDAHACPRPAVRLELAAVGGCLWHPECQEAAPKLPASLPTDFDSVEHYVGTFEPLLHEEARAGLRTAYQEARSAGKGWQTQVARCERAAGSSGDADAARPRPGTQPPAAWRTGAGRAWFGHGLCAGALLLG